VKPARLLAVLLCTAVAVGCQAGYADAASAVSSGVSKASACVTGPAASPRTDDRPATTQTAAIGQYKARHNAYESRMPALVAASVAASARKNADLAAGRFRVRTAACGVTRFAGNTTIGGLVHYGQIRNWYCGPATVAEMSATVPGPSAANLDQNAVAGYLGTTQSAGTSADRMADGLNHYVGVPDFGRNFYTYVWVNDTPTAAQRSTFVSNLKTDIGVFSPVAGNGWEVPGGPHLVGHPANQEIFHFFEIGGYNDTQVYYADSANTVWNSVPNYSWFDTYTMVTILGGRGYVW